MDQTKPNLLATYGPNQENQKVKRSALGKENSRRVAAKGTARSLCGPASELKPPKQGHSNQGEGGGEGEGGRGGKGGEGGERGKWGWRGGGEWGWRGGGTTTTPKSNH